MEDAVARDVAGAVVASDLQGPHPAGASGAGGVCSTGCACRWPPGTRPGVLPDLFRRLLGKIGPGMLVLADRNFWAANCGPPPPRPGRTCCGGPAPTPGCPWSPNWPTAPTCPTWPRPAPGDAGRRMEVSDDLDKLQRITVRVIEYTLASSSSAYPHKAGEVYRLVTTIGDPRPRPGRVISPPPTHSAGRSSLVFDELKTHQLQSLPACCAPSDPDGVEQEIWGILLVHHAIRDLIHVSRPRPAAYRPRPGAVRLALRPPGARSATRRGFPSDYAAPPQEAVAELLQRLNKRRRRYSPRVVRQTHRTPFPPRNPPTGTSSNHHQI